MSDDTTATLTRWGVQAKRENGKRGLVGDSWGPSLAKTRKEAREWLVELRGRHGPKWGKVVKVRATFEVIG